MIIKVNEDHYNQVRHLVKWFLYQINWSDDYCLKHRVDKEPHGYHGEHYSCPLCREEENENIKNSSN